MGTDKQTTAVSTIRSSIRLFLVIFVLTGTLISGVMLAMYRSATDTDMTNIKEKERFAVLLQHQAVSDILLAITGDLLFLSQQNELTDYLSTGDEALLDKIGAEYVSISKQKGIYDQIRFLDTLGMEIVRVNANNGAPVSVTASELQSKQKRYYFQDCFKLSMGEVFISPFDLNVEQGKIEVPFKPMIRLGTPIFDQAGEKRGIVLANYNGKNLLDKIVESEGVSGGEAMLLNAEGYWLLNPDPGQEWGFMFKDEQRTLAVADEEAWKIIQAKNQGQIETAKGIYTFKTIYPLNEEQYRSSTGSVEAFGLSSAEVGPMAYRWHLVSFFSAERIAGTFKIILMKFFFIGAALFFLIAVGALVIAFAITKQKMYQAQLEVMALFDPLTKLPNRTLFFDRLQMTAEHSRRYTSPFGLFYIDLDGFKEVNDSFGHEAGDELLTIVAGLFLNISRKSDTVARLGGDEFAVIYAEIESLQLLESFACRIIEALSSPIELTAGGVTIETSIGIAYFPADTEDIGELVNLCG